MCFGISGFRVLGFLGGVLGGLRALGFGFGVWGFGFTVGFRA